MSDHLSWTQYLDGWQREEIRYCKRACTCGIMNNDSGWEILEPTSGPSRILYIHLYIFRKDMKRNWLHNADIHVPHYFW